MLFNDGALFQRCLGFGEQAQVERGDERLALVRENKRLLAGSLNGHVGRGDDQLVPLAADPVRGFENEKRHVIGGQKIAVEIKSFTGSSNISEFHTALGQYLDYEQALEEQEPSRVLYLAVPGDIYDTFFTLQFIQTVIHRYQLRLIIYEPEQEVIIRWQS